MSIPREYKILGGIALGAIILGYVLFRFGGSGPTTVKPLIERSGAYSRGGQNTQVTLTEFSDFQCPACRIAQSTVDKIMSDYSGQVKLVFRHLPLDIHPLAKIAAEAAEAAGHQGKFWEMHDLLYSRQTDWGDISKNLTEAQALEIFKNYAQELGLDVNKFSSDVSSNAYNAVISEDYNDALASGINATPTFFVNDKVISSPSYNDIKQGIDAALK